MRNIVFLPIELIKKAEEENWLRSLSYFVRMKSLYKNNTHYNFTLRSLGDKINCSPATLSFHLKVLEDKGLITYHSGNVTFMGLEKMRVKWRYRSIGVTVDSKNQLDILRGQIIRFNLTSQAHKIKKSGVQLRNKGFIPYTKTEMINSSYVGLSAKGVGSLFYLSQASGSRIRKKLNSLRQFLVTPVYSKLIDNCTLNDYILLRKHGNIPYHSFFIGNKILVERRNSMEYIGNVSSLQKLNSCEIN